MPTRITAYRKVENQPEQGYIIAMGGQATEVTHEDAEKLGRYLLFEDN